jgi:hypothetical protein
VYPGGKRSLARGTAGGGTGVKESAFFRQSDGTGLDRGEFAPSSRLDVLLGENRGRFAEVEIAFEERLAHSQQFTGIVVGPLELALDRIDWKNAAEGAEREIEEQSGPDELGRPGRGDGLN